MVGCRHKHGIDIVTLNRFFIFCRDQTLFVLIEIVDVVSGLVEVQLITVAYSKHFEIGIVHEVPGISVPLAPHADGKDIDLLLGETPLSSPRTWDFKKSGADMPTATVAKNRRRVNCVFMDKYY